MVREDQVSAIGEDQEMEVAKLKRRLDVLDQRLDNIDSMVTAIAERVMKQPVTFNMTCPHCGRDIEIAMLGAEKPAR